MAKKTAQINVTARDIRVGRQRSFLTCPIALAAQRRLKRIITLVDFGRIYMERDDGFTDAIDLPQKAVNFISQFDDHGRRGLKPFRFTVEL